MRAGFVVKYMGGAARAGRGGRRGWWAGHRRVWVVGRAQGNWDGGRAEMRCIYTRRAGHGAVLVTTNPYPRVHCLNVQKETSIVVATPLQWCRWPPLRRNVLRHVARSGPLPQKLGPAISRAREASTHALSSIQHNGGRPEASRLRPSPDAQGIAAPLDSRAANVIRHAALQPKFASRMAGQGWRRSVISTCAEAQAGPYAPHAHERLHGASA